MFRYMAGSYLVDNYVILRSERRINNRKIKNHDQSIKKDDTKIKELLREYKFRGRITSLPRKDPYNTVNIGDIVQFKEILIRELSTQEKHLVRLRRRRKSYSSVTVRMARDRFCGTDMIVNGIHLIFAERENPSVGNDINGLLSQTGLHDKSAKHHV